MLGERPVASGRICGAPACIWVFSDQAWAGIAGERPLLDEVAAALGETDAGAVRTLLAKFGLGPDHIARPCDSLSLGERTRAVLALLQGRAVNVLVLDEPTNHLDVAAIDQLQNALVAFDGTLVIVTHDRALLDALELTAVWRFTRTDNRGAWRGEGAS
ncbi:MAG: hypothetical protein R2742_04940 [Micropruina glycogenica]